MSKFIVRSISLSPELEKFVVLRESEAEKRGFKFNFSHYVRELIREKENLNVSHDR